jgi:hypothetical protein
MRFPHDFLQLDSEPYLQVDPIVKTAKWNRRLPAVMPGFVAQVFHPDLTGSKFGAAGSGQEVLTLSYSKVSFPWRRRLLAGIMRSESSWRGLPHRGNPEFGDPMSGEAYPSMI